MSKPIVPVTIFTVDRQSREIEAILDSGSHATIVREAALPPGAPVLRYSEKSFHKTAARRGRLSITGATQLVIELAGKRIKVLAEVSPDVVRDLIIGAAAMQSWDVTIRNEGGTTTVEVAHDMRDPDIDRVELVRR